MYESLFVNASSYVGVDVQVSGDDHKDSRIDAERLPRTSWRWLRSSSRI